jgi:sugar lactone lactonase YvrE
MRQATVLTDGLGFVEGPRWHDGRLWLSDSTGGVVLALGPDGEVAPVVAVPGEPSGLGWLPDGRLLVVSWERRRLMRLDPEGLVEHADLRGVATFHCNDMVVDGRGRAWVGNWGFDLGAYLDGRDLLAVAAVPDLPTAALARVDPDGAVAVAATGLRFPNGTVVTPDGATLVVAETFAERLTAFDVGADGTLANRRVWAELPGVVPDGIALDAEGAIWVANPLAPECLRVAPGGAVLERVATSQPCYACALGGPDRATLYLLTNPPFDTAAIGGGGGRVETVPVAVPGAGWP